MSRTRMVWSKGHKALPKTEWLLEAVPGVGNVGKLLVDSLVDAYENELVVKILHPDLPPHATLDSEGYLIPPSLNIHKITLPKGGSILTLSSNFQPITPAGQHEVASVLLEACKSAGVGRVLILAGLAAEPGDAAVHLVCPSAEDRAAMEKLGLVTSTKHPSAGIIGLTGMVASLAPTFGQPAICAVAETVGTSVDVVAADRLAKWIDESFKLGLALALDSTESTAEKLRSFFELEEVAELDAMFGPEGEGESEAFYA
jgi:proteasome assembly chaperone (PAC2) family protein